MMKKSSGLIIACLFLLTSCELFHPRGALRPPPPKPEPAFIPIVDHAVRYLDKHDNIIGTKLEVANAALTVPVNGEMMLSGNLYFSVDHEYQSASGKLCKELTIFNSGSLLFENVCYDNMHYTMEYLENIFATEQKNSYTRASRRLVNQDEIILPDEGI